MNKSIVKANKAETNYFFIGHENSHKCCEVAYYGKTMIYSQRA